MAPLLQILQTVYQPWNDYTQTGCGLCCPTSTAKASYSMPLSADRRKHYRSLGHKLKPVVTVAGKGLSETVLGELNRALEDHELIKVKLAISDREQRKAVLQALLEATRAELVQEIGKIALIFRAAREPKPKLSNLSP